MYRTFLRGLGKNLFFFRVLTISQANFAGFALLLNEHLLILNVNAFLDSLRVIRPHLSEQI